MKQFGLFFLVGSCGFLVDAAITLILVSGTGLSALVARLPAFVLATMVTYALNRRFTFPGPHASWATGWLVYVFATAIGAVINYSVYSLVILFLGEPPAIILLGVATGSAVGLLSNYTFARVLVFRHAARD